MKYYIYKFEDNWADEMNVQGFAILTEKEKDMALAYIRREYKRGGTIYFGTNEENDYKSLRDVMNCISFEEITSNQYNTIQQVFGDNSFGELGPLDLDELEEPEVCEECGEELGEDDEDGICSSCQEEAEEEERNESEYDNMADKVVRFIMTEYGLEKTASSDHHSRIKWKPTPKTELDITIAEYDGSDEEEIEITLYLNRKKVGYDSFVISDITNNPGHYLKDSIKHMIEKAKKY